MNDDHTLWTTQRKMGKDIQDLEDRVRQEYQIRIRLGYGRKNSIYFDNYCLRGEIWSYSLGNTDRKDTIRQDLEERVSQKY